MINKRKAVRDALIILILVSGGWFLLRSRGTGPLEMAGGPRSGMPPGHGMPRPELSEGEAVVRLGDRTIGRVWFEDTAARMQRELSAHGGAVEEETGEFAQMEALIEGLYRLIEAEAIERWGIEPDESLIQAQRDAFNSGFGSEQEADAFLRQMGVSRERLEQKWMSDSLRRSLMDRVAMETGAEPGSPEAEQAFDRWVQRSIEESEFVFLDPSLEALYRKYQAQAAEAGRETLSAGENEDAVEQQVNRESG